MIDVCPGLTAGLIPIERGKDFQQHFLSPHFESTFVNLVPNTRAGFIYIAIFGGGTPAGTVSLTLWAFHRADKGSFL
jgi:hypothetical protein